MRVHGAEPTADQMRVLKMLEQLAGAADWRGVAAQERTARAVAAAVRTSMPSIASFVYSILGRAHQNLGSFFKALEYHAQDLSIAKEVGDRAGEGNAKGNLGIAYQSQGDFSKAIEYHTLDLATESPCLRPTPIRTVGARRTRKRAKIESGCGACARSRC